jgi:hydrogenase nickel incorporation protein HypB
MAEKAVADWNLESFDFLFIENVGNLVALPALTSAENLRLVLVSTTEGEDKPLKYPTIFNTADVAVITKLDLPHATGFEQTLIDNIHNVRPAMPILKVSARTGEGVAAMEQCLVSRRDELLRACTT